MQYNIDSHVHIYKDFPSLEIIAAQSKAEKNILFVLETRKTVTWHELLQKNSIKEISPGFAKFTHKQQTNYLIQGYQIITAEKLEVLALGMTDVIADGLSLSETVEKILKNNAIPVLPWSPGKWLGKRGDVLREFLSSTKKESIFLGDIKGRPTTLVGGYFGLPKNNIFSLGFNNVSGSDPLPLDGEWKRILTFGDTVSTQAEVRNLEEAVKILCQSNLSFGEQECLVSCVKRNLLLRF